MQLIGRMRKERFMAAFSAAIVLAILVTACGGSDPTATPVPPATATPVPQATDAPVPQATATPVPQATATPVPPATATPVPQPTATPAPPSPNRGGVFRTQDVGIPHLDPTIIDVSGQANFLDVIYDGLLTMRANDYNDFAVIGQLASSWTVSADGRSTHSNCRRTSIGKTSSPSTGGLSRLLTLDGLSTGARRMSLGRPSTSTRTSSVGMLRMTTPSLSRQRSRWLNSCRS